MIEHSNPHKRGGYKHPHQKDGEVPYEASVPMGDIPPEAREAAERIDLKQFEGIIERDLFVYNKGKGWERDWRSSNALAALPDLTKELARLREVGRVSCVGNGTTDSGCGQNGGLSGFTCPKCGGMLLSDKARLEAQSNALASLGSENERLTRENAEFRKENLQQGERINAMREERAENEDRIDAQSAAITQLRAENERLTRERDERASCVKMINEDVLRVMPYPGSTWPHHGLIEEFKKQAARIATLEQQARESAVYIKHLKEQNSLLLSNNESLNVEATALQQQAREMEKDGKRLSFLIHLGPPGASEVGVGLTEETWDFATNFADPDDKTSCDQKAVRQAIDAATAATNEGGSEG